MADNETIADIIAEMRGMGNYQRYSGDHARVLANRLEAAHRRERGNAAKLREALEMVRDAHYTKEVGGELYEGFEVEVDDGTGRPLICVVKNALAAPARNCDRPECATTKAAQEVWRREDGSKTAYYEWLLATATEKEGGNDAD